MAEKKKFDFSTFKPEKNPAKKISREKKDVK
jgi:hypothetical protein